MPSRLIVAFILVLALSAPAAADWILLKDGIQVHGTVLRQTEREVTLISTNGGKLTFNMKNVAKVHLNDPQRPKTQKETEEKKKKASQGIFLHKLRESAQRFRAQPRRFGDAVYSLPGTFQPLRARGAQAGYVGELLGIYRESSTGAAFSVVLGQLPLGARDVAGLESTLKQHLGRERGYQLTVLRGTELDGLPAVYAEFIGESPEGPRQFLQQWVLIEEDEVYSSSLAVSRANFLREPQRYRKILESFRREREDSRDTVEPGDKPPSATTKASSSSSLP